MELLAVKRNTWWAWQIACDCTTGLAGTRRAHVNSKSWRWLLLPFVHMNLGKCKFFLKISIKLAHDASKEARKLFMADVVKMVVTVPAGFRHDRRKSASYHTSGGCYGILMGVMSRSEALSRAWWKTVVYTKTSLHFGGPDKGPISLLSCRRGLPPWQSGPRSACTCN